MVFYDEITDNDATEENASVESTESTVSPDDPIPGESVKTELSEENASEASAETEATEENVSESSEAPAQSEKAPAQSSNAVTESENSAPLPSEEESRNVGRLVSASGGKKSYNTGTKVAAFVFFIITAGIFLLYEYFAFTFLYLPLMESIDNLGEAIAAIFGYIFGLIYTLIFAVAQLPANVVSIILFKRLRGKSDKKWENVLFTVFFALSLVMLLITVLSTALFFVTSAVGG